MGNRIRTVSTETWCKNNSKYIIIDPEILGKVIRGIYAFLVEDKCVYIGKAINIRERIYDHLSKLKWLVLGVELKEIPEHITILKNAFDTSTDGIIKVKILEIVDYEYENYCRDLHHLAFREYAQIEEHQMKGECLNQYPEGAYNVTEYNNWQEKAQKAARAEYESLS